MSFRQLRHDFAQINRGIVSCGVLPYFAVLVESWWTHRLLYNVEYCFCPVPQRVLTAVGACPFDNVAETATCGAHTFPSLVISCLIFANGAFMRYTYYTLRVPCLWLVEHSTRAIYVLDPRIYVSRSLSVAGNDDRRNTRRHRQKYWCS